MPVMKNDSYSHISLNLQYFPFSLRRSMYFDEDGDLAHEFYEEVLVPAGNKKSMGYHGKTKPYMRRVAARRLRPQGDVIYPHPRLHVDFPIVMYQG